MQVETYEVAEISNHPEVSDECLRIIGELGLGGQKSLAGDSGNQQPYRVITADEFFAYKMLCPVETPLCEYKASAIPLRVLHVAEHATKTGMFANMVVWHPQFHVEKDPVLIGVHHNKGRSWDRQLFLLARWGEELHPLDVCLRMAGAKWLEWHRANQNIIISRAKSELAALDSLTPESVIHAVKDKSDPFYSTKYGHILRD